MLWTVLNKKPQQKRQRHIYSYDTTSYQCSLTWAGQGERDREHANKSFFHVTIDFGLWIPEQRIDEGSLLNVRHISSAEQKSREKKKADLKGSQIQEM